MLRSLPRLLPQELHLPLRNPPRLRLHRQPPHLTGPPRRPPRRKHNPPLRHKRKHAARRLLRNHSPNRRLSKQTDLAPLAQLRHLPRLGHRPPIHRHRRHCPPMVQQAEGPRLWHRRRRKWNRRADLHASRERHDQPLRHIMDLRHPLHNSMRRQHGLCPHNPQGEPHSRHETSCDQQNAFPSSGVLASSLLGLSEHPRVRGSALCLPDYANSIGVTAHKALLQQPY